MKILRHALLMTPMLMPIHLAAATLEQQPGSERQQQLRQLLAQDCSVCHSKSLQGDLGPPLTAKALAGKSEEYLVQSITEGHEETAMPPWWWMMDENDARWLVRYIRGGNMTEK